MKGYIVTDDRNELCVVAETRAKATGTFIRRFAWSHLDWRSLRTKRFPDIDGDDAWIFDSGAFATVEYWGARVRLP